MALSAREARRRRAFQDAFFRRLGGPQPLRAIFDRLSDVSFCVKDLGSRFVCASRAILGKFGMLDEVEIVGTTDADRYPPRLAEVFRASDREVMGSGRPVVDRLEVWYGPEGSVDWCLVTKLPLRDPRGAVVGVMVAMRPWRGSRRELAPGSRLGRIVEEIRSSPGGAHRVSALARRAGLSPRQLQRRFVELFGVGVKEFLMRARIRAAADALRSTDAPVAAIALDCGFYDQSAFTRHFRRRTGITPERYRRRYAGRTPVRDFRRAGGVPVS